MQMHSAVNHASTSSPSQRHEQGSPIDALGTMVVYRTNHEIWSAGDPSELCYKVLSGAVRTVRLAADGRRQILEFVLPGELFGFDSLAKHYASAEAISRTTLIRYPRRRIERLTDTDNTLARRLQEMVAEKLDAAQRRVFLLGRKSADERVASFLLEMFQRQGGKKPELVLPMPRQDIADHIGLTIETISRALGRLKREGTIETSASTHIRLCDYDSLLKASGDT